MEQDGLNDFIQWYYRWSTTREMEKEVVSFDCHLKEGKWSGNFVINHHCSETQVHRCVAYSNSSTPGCFKMQNYLNHLKKCSSKVTPTTSSSPPSSSTTPVDALNSGITQNPSSHSSSTMSTDEACSVILEKFQGTGISFSNVSFCLQNNSFTVCCPTCLNVLNGYVYKRPDRCTFNEVKTIKDHLESCLVHSGSGKSIEEVVSSFNGQFKLLYPSSTSSSSKTIIKCLLCPKFRYDVQTTGSLPQNLQRHLQGDEHRKNEKQYRNQPKITSMYSSQRRIIKAIDFSDSILASSCLGFSSSDEILYQVWRFSLPYAFEKSGFYPLDGRLIRLVDNVTKESYEIVPLFRSNNCSLRTKDGTIFSNFICAECLKAEKDPAIKAQVQKRKKGIVANRPYTDDFIDFILLRGSGSRNTFSNYRLKTLNLIRDKNKQESLRIPRDTDDDIRDLMMNIYKLNSSGSIDKDHPLFVLFSNFISNQLSLARTGNKKGFRHDPLVKEFITILSWVGGKASAGIFNNMYDFSESLLKRSRNDLLVDFEEGEGPPPYFIHL